jgi:hypothetical protein
VFGCISVVVVEDVYVRDCRGLGLCAFGRVGLSEAVECVECRGSMVMGWGGLEGKVNIGERVEEKGQKE